MRRTTIRPAAPPPDLTAVQDLLEPIITRAAIDAVLDQLLDALCGGLRQAGLGARHVTLSAWRVDGAVQEVAIGTGLPTRAPAHLRRLFAERLERLEPDLGFERMVLEARATEPVAAGVQSDLEIGGERDEAAAAMALAQVSIGCGSGCRSIVSSPSPAIGRSARSPRSTRMARSRPCPGLGRTTAARAAAAPAGTAGGRDAAAGWLALAVTVAGHRASPPPGRRPLAAGARMVAGPPRSAAARLLPGGTRLRRAALDLPDRSTGGTALAAAWPSAMIGFAELGARSNFSFLDGASHPAELVQTAATLGLAGLGHLRHQQLAGVVRGHVAAKEAGLPSWWAAAWCCWTVVLAGLADRPGSLRPADRTPVTRTHERPKGECHLVRVTSSPPPGLGAGGHPAWPGPMPLSPPAARRYRGAPGPLGVAAAVAVSCTYRGDDQRRLDDWWEIAAGAAGGACSPRATFVTTIRRGGAGRCADRHPAGHAGGRAGLALPSQCRAPSQAAGRDGAAVRRYPEALARTLEMAVPARFSLDELRYEYPDEVCARRRNRAGAPCGLTWRRPGDGIPRGAPEGPEPIAHELALIGGLDYAPYFLTVHDIVRFARGQGILCQGRGSAANSAVCYASASPRSTRAGTTWCSSASSRAGARRAAGHRRRLRARAARGGDPVHLRAVRPRPRRRSAPP